jgi:hypothetical protein
VKRRRKPSERCDCAGCQMWWIRVKRWERRRRFATEAPPEPYPERRHS